MPVTTTAIHHITTIHGQAQSESHGVAACPRRHEAVDLSECLGCAHLLSIEGGGKDAEHLLCATRREQEAAALPGTVGAVMARDVFCIREDVSLETVVALLRQHHFGALPVVDADGVPLGIVSKSDVVRVLAEGRIHDDLDTFDVAGAARPVHVAKEMMTPIVVTFEEGDSLAHAAARLKRSQVHHAPVVGRDGEVVGVVTTFDLLAALETHEPRPEDRR